MSGPLPDYLAPLAVPASWVYGRAVALRNARYDRGDGVERLDVPVISVGNITTGGTGKTPVVAHIAELLIDSGVTPAIAMRGYGATHQSRDRKGAAGADEALEYAERLPGVDVIVDPERATACRRFLAERPDIGCIILDDGFQHRQLHRNLDLVLIDATRRTFDDRLLPAGHLREPLENLARADAVIVTRADALEDAPSQISNLKSQIEHYHGRPPLAWTRHVWMGLRLVSAEPSLADVTWLQGKRLATLLGIGNPAAMIAQLEAAGATVVANIPAADHERFTVAKLELARMACEGLDGLAMTAKDWARCGELMDFNRWRVPIVIPHLAIEVFEGEADLRDCIAQVASSGRHGPAR